MAFADAIADTLKDIAHRFEQTHRDLLPLEGELFPLPKAITLQRHYTKIRSQSAGLQTLTLVCEMKPITEIAYQVTLSATFHGDGKPERKSQKGYYVLDNNVWRFTSRKNRIVQEELDSASVVDILAGIL